MHAFVTPFLIFEADGLMKFAQGLRANFDDHPACVARIADSFVEPGGRRNGLGRMVGIEDFGGTPEVLSGSSKHRRQFDSGISRQHNLSQDADHFGQLRFAFPRDAEELLPDPGQRGIANELSHLRHPFAKTEDRRPNLEPKNIANVILATLGRQVAALAQAHRESALCARKGGSPPAFKGAMQILGERPDSRSLASHSLQPEVQAVQSPGWLRNDFFSVKLCHNEQSKLRNVSLKSLDGGGLLIERGSIRAGRLGDFAAQVTHGQVRAPLTEAAGFRLARQEGDLEDSRLREEGCLPRTLVRVSIAYANVGRVQVGNLIADCLPGQSKGPRKILGQEPGLCRTFVRDTITDTNDLDRVRFEEFCDRNESSHLSEPLLAIEVSCENFREDSVHATYTRGEQRSGLDFFANRRLAHAKMLGNLSDGQGLIAQVTSKENCISFHDITKHSNGCQ